MEVEEAKEEMIEVEAARLILEGETRCLIRPLISSRTAWRLCPLSKWTFYLYLLKQDQEKLGTSSIVSGGKFYQKDGERRGYEPEVFSRIFWEQTKAEEEEERFVKSNTYLGAIEYIIGVI